MFEPLTEREIEILRLTADGLTNAEISAHLYLSLNTVKWYCKRIYEKLGAENRTQAIKHAQTLGILASNTHPIPLSRPHYHLPTPLTTLIGRRNEINQVKQLLRQNRLLTLTGPGGIGKTRLALQVAEEVGASFADGVCFVDLSSINEAPLVINSIAHVLNVAETFGTPLLTLLRTTLSDKQLLLVLDNFEHLLDAAPLVADLLAATNNLKCLITSREMLALYGEQEYVVPPLTLPDMEWFAINHLAANTLINSEALQLFERCAQSVHHDFRLTAENMPSISAICLRLDGLPLAIELAAAYIKLLSPQAMLTQLDSMWLEMTRSMRNVPARQQTLRNTIEWSYRFLEEEERRLFARLSIFRGGCTWEAIIATCADQPATSSAMLLETLNGLVNKSLVWRRSDLNGQARFGMLETIREFAWRILNARGEAETLQEQHAHYYTQYTSQIEAEQVTVRQRLILNKLEIEVDNFRVALRWSLDHDPEPGLRMIGDLATCWRIRGYLAEGMDWAEQLLATSNVGSISVLTRAYASTAILSLVLGQRAQAQRLADQSCQLALQVADPPTSAQAFHARAMTLMAPNLTEVEYAEINQLGNDAAQLYASSNNWLGYGRILNLLGEVKRMQEDYSGAQRDYEESLQGLRQIGYQSGVTTSLMNLGWTALHQGQYQKALAYFAEGFQLSHELNYPHNLAMSLHGIAGVLARLQQPQTGAQLLGAADGLRARIAIVIDLSDIPDCERARNELQEQLSPADFAQHWQAGRTLTIEAVAAMVTSLHKSL